MTNDWALADALRLAVDPPGGVNVDALRELTRADSEEDWGIAAAAEHLGVSPHTLRYYERIGLVVILGTTRGIAGSTPRPYGASFS